VSQLLYYSSYLWLFASPPRNMKMINVYYNYSGAMTEIPRPASRAQFRIAILCALRIESEAVEAIFDEFYERNDDEFGQDPSDKNIYRIGRIGNHYVILVYMDGIGKCRAMTTTLHLKLSYPLIQLAFVVGVCGGVPYSNDCRDIFLGDVLVSDRL
ncbi:hypothetical protein KXW36_001523, partial [Aspergillus fumigatus]